MPNLLKKCRNCGELRDAETEYHYNGHKYVNGEKKKRKDCVHCCNKRRREYWKVAEKRLGINERRRRNYAENKDGARDKHKNWTLRILYGITTEKYNEMRKQQDYKCAICKIDESKVPRKKLCVDHCHKTKKVRGLLCSRCNSILGFFDEDVSKIQRAIDFLERVRSIR